jgi:hypothetical protein
VGTLSENVTSSIARAFAPRLERPPVADSPGEGLGTPLWQFPNFFKTDDGQLGSPQADHFGFYALAKAVHSVLVGSMYLQAGDALRDSGFCAPRVVCYYTAALNMTQAHLALCGRVFVDNPKGPLKPDAEHRPGKSMFEALEPEPGSVVGVLTTHGRWVFEGRSQNHASRWSELDRVYPNGSGLPEAFVELFEYVLSYGPHEYGDICEEDDYDAALLREGGRAVAQARHVAMYQGFGYDDFALDLLMNGESNGVGLDRKAEAFRSFIVDAGAQALYDALDAIMSINQSDWDRLQPMFVMAVMTPEFELPAVDAGSDNNYAQLLSKLVVKVLPVRSRRRPED